MFMSNSSALLAYLDAKNKVRIGPVIELFLPSTCKTLGGSLTSVKYTIVSITFFSTKVGNGHHIPLSLGKWELQSSKIAIN